MAKSYFYDESISDWRELVKGERGEDGATIIVNDETAQRAEAAQTGAETARDLVLPARDETLAARDQAVAAKWLRGALSSSDNIDNLYEEDHTGAWRVVTNTISTDLGLPVMSPGILEVTYIVGVAQPSAFQTWRPRTGSSWERVRRSGAWLDWSQKAAPQAEIDDAIQAAYESALEHATPPLDAGYTGVPNSQLQDDFRDAYPLVSTGGKGVVCLRWDHGLTNFKDILQPLHEQYEIPGIIAMNSRNWDIAENSGMTKAEAAALAADGLIEWANHGADDGAGGSHRDESTREGIWDQIYNGRVELENDLGIPIWQYLVPGTGGSGMGGFYGGNSLDVFTRTYAGSVIMSTHAVSSGGFSELVYRPLDGRIRHGGSRWAAETSTVEQVKTVIDQAASNGTCIWLMSHPRNIGSEGHLSAADWEEIFSYIHQKIQNNELANISPLQSNHATAQE